jgi:poly(hydroxyalkanoate) granule-associated protein
MDDTVDEGTWQSDVEYEPNEAMSDRAEETARRMMLAGLGAVAMAVDAAEDTFDRLVDRGERVQSELEERAREARRGRLMRRSRLGNAFRNAMDAFLDTLAVPNKADIDTINVKLNILTRKIDDLQMDEAMTREARAGSASSVPTPDSAPPTPDQE